MASTTYLFRPHLRLGVSSYLKQEDAIAADTTAKAAQLEMVLNITATTTADITNDTSVSKLASVDGPFEAQFREEEIRSQDPRNDVGDFEPNYFPTVEFRSPDYPWRYTPFSAGASHNLKPWFALIVLVAENSHNSRREFEVGPARASSDRFDAQQLPFIRNVATRNLPDLEQSWRWAHVQVIGDDSLATGIEDGTLLELVKTRPSRVSSRLMCSRRLSSGTLYNAFIVPVFKLGWVAAGLQQDDDAISIRTLAWDAGISATVDLPYYYRWEFRTGERGDFEKLVRDLRPRVLKDIGLRPLTCDKPGYGLQGNDPNGPLTLGVEGALRSLDTLYSQWGRDSGEDPWTTEELQKDLAELLNHSNDHLEHPATSIDPVDGETDLTAVEMRRKSELVEVTFRASSSRTFAVQYSDSQALVTQEEDLLDTDGVTHRFRITNLDEGHRYRLYVVARVGTRWERISQVVTFRYQGLPLVMPPLYGQWHAKRPRTSTRPAATSWFDTLNTDPRHRAAAGVGSEVVRNEQEPLMASAWEQAGDIDFANSIIKYAQLGVAASRDIHRRMEQLDPEEFLVNTRRLHARSMVDHPEGRLSLAGHVKRSRVPKAVLDGAYRRLSRKAGPVKKRMKRGGRKPDQLVVTRFNQGFRAAGDPLLPGGTVDVSQTLEITRNRYHNLGETLAHDDARSPDTKAPSQSTKAAAERARTVLRDLQPLLETLPDLDTSAPSSTGLVDLFLSIDRALVSGEDASRPISDEPDAAERYQVLLGNLPALLASDEPPLPGPQLDLDSVRTQLLDQLEPTKAIGDRLRHRLRIADRGVQVFDEIMPAPTFPQPMYVHLQTISKDYICPGIETLKNNTVALLATNSRFIESFMCGLNHEFAAELLWREYPTDQRGTYFKQFWTPIRSVPMEEAAKQHVGLDATAEEIERTLTKMLEDIRPIDEWRVRKLGDNPSTLSDLRSAPAGEVDTGCEDDEKLVVVIRGDLLKKYPRTEISIYREEENASSNKTTKAFFDDYQQTMNPENSPSFSGDPPKIFEPSIRADVPADITLLGFDIRVCDLLKGKYYLILEEQVERVRYGLDIRYAPPDGESTPPSWDNLSWDHFGMNDPQEAGAYLDDTELPASASLPADLGEWGKSSAQIAAKTQQKPVRIAISLNDMIPPEVLGE